MTDKPTVLVVDDEKNIPKILRIGLEAIGLTVEAFGNPVDALDHLEPGRYDLAFIDLMMAPVDGMHVLREIKKKSPSTTAVIITAHGSIDSGAPRRPRDVHQRRRGDLPFDSPGSRGPRSA